MFSDWRRKEGVRKGSPRKAVCVRSYYRAGYYQRMTKNKNKSLSG